jgi:cellulose synthase/poly-beta-1,6-N-acetylglucosamine synthase-like glycosyltransferase
MGYRGWAGAVADRAADGDCAAPATAAAIFAAPAQHRFQPHPIPAPPLAPELSTCAELDCVRHLLPWRILALAEQRANAIDVGADRVLIAWGLISEEAYVAALATRLGVAFEPLTQRPRQQCPLTDAALIDAVQTGMLPVTRLDGPSLVLAPCLLDSRRLTSLLISGTDAAQRIRLTTTARLQDFVARHAGAVIAHRAADALRLMRPELSAGAGRPRRRLTALVAALVAIPALLAPSAFVTAVEITLGAVFTAWTALRLLGLLTERLVRRRPQALPDAWLPTYSIVIALYREAAAVEGLVAAMRGLEYPIEKLDIKLVIEPDDHGTRLAIARLELGPPFEMIVAPAYGPRTKPKALNAALPFVRGKFVAVFDAEDRPEPDQLRLALEAFVASDRRLACVQARLTIDNTADSWLTRLFTAEYAGLFDVFLPGLAAWRLPLPLGGSSNHFRTDVLREVGAWDPHNVTEDADLGMRLARFGYRTAMIASTTYEEAPSRLQPWLAQRTRWFKGWMQTFLVHMRAPHRLAGELGWPGFAEFLLLVGGTVLAELVHGLFAARLAFRFATASPDDAMWINFDATMLLAGYAIFAFLSLIGLARRALLGCAWALLLTPLYWLLLSAAAWRALWQLLRDPYRWEKTDHGLARNSRLAASLKDAAGAVRSGS